MTPPTAPRGTPNRTPGTWYAHDTTTKDNRPVWHSEVRAVAGAGVYSTVALCRSQPYQRQDAEYIVLACNAHAPLVEALAAFLGQHGHTELCRGPEGSPCRVRCAQARAALAMARGEQ